MSNITTTTTTNSTSSSSSDTNADDGGDLSFHSSHDAVSLATMAIWIYLIPHLYIKYAEYTLALKRSKTWGPNHKNKKITQRDDDGEGGQEQTGEEKKEKEDDDHDNDTKFQTACKHVTYAFVGNLIFAIILYVISSLLIHTATHHMDRSMTLIVTGTSRLFAGVLFLILSIDVPKWLGVYYSSNRKTTTTITTSERNKNDDDSISSPLSSSSMFPTINSSTTFQYIFASTNQRSIMESIQIDQMDSLREIRFMFTWSLWKKMSTMFWYNLFFSCNTQIPTDGRPELNTLYGIIVGVCIGTLLAVITSLGRCKYKQYKRLVTIIISSLFVCCYIALIVLGVYFISTVWFPDRNMKVFAGSFFAITIVVALIVHGLMVYQTKRKIARQKMFRYNSELFSQKKLRSTSIALLVDNMDDNGNNNKNSSTIMDDAVPLPVPSTMNDEEVHGVDNNNNDAAAANNESIEPLAALVPLPPPAKKTKEVNGDNNNDDDDEDNTKNKVDTDGNNKPSHSIPSSYYTLLVIALYRTWPYLCCCFRSTSTTRTNTSDNNNSSTTDVIGEKEGQGTAKTATAPLIVQSLTIGLGRLLWYLSSIFLLFLTIVNIGSTGQQSVVREHLYPAWEFLYPENYNNGTMCAWDEPTPNATIKTFDTLQAVYDANYSVVHCGACANCSNYPDMSLEYTTRHDLSPLSKACAQESLFGGTVEDVQKCNEDTIGFSSPCSYCWTYDELNTKEHCFWIYFQSIFIKAVADFQVAFDDVTSATCDEAMSGPFFVPCSGATRRRMNIVSLIARPKSQQCQVIEQDWDAIFG